MNNIQSPAEKTSAYLKKIVQSYQLGNATEHTYRPAFKEYLESLFQNANHPIMVTNEPKRQQCGAPDYILSQKIGADYIPVGYIEAKDIGKDLDKLKTDDQLTRYMESLDNFIFTDYLQLIFFMKGKEYARVRLAQVQDNTIVPVPENFDKCASLLEHFITYRTQTISSASDLAHIMANKAKLMKYNFIEVLKSDQPSDLKIQLKEFRTKLMQDMDQEKFASMYAETITYGLFTARLNDNSLDTFSRAESYDLIPKNNPFLRKLFFQLVVNAEDNIKWSIDELCEVLRYADVYGLLTHFHQTHGVSKGKTDPIIHFYEDFVKEVDPAKRKSMGVYYTPEPVVDFIIRAMDEVLKEYFHLPLGIADSSKIHIQRDDKDQDVHKVQLLDVATGTGTFIVQTIKHIYERCYQGQLGGGQQLGGQDQQGGGQQLGGGQQQGGGQQLGGGQQQGLWSAYVDQHLLPRLHGFENSMSSYAMCHLKVDLFLKETQYTPKSLNHPKRLGVYLTNSLEEAHGADKTTDAFAQFLTDESHAASEIKRDTPVMVAFGNPPYSGESQNKNDYIMDLMKAYKQEPSGGKLKEKNPKWINDDYVKFIRLGEHYIEKNGEGVLAYITNHGYLDNPTFRGMRYHLLNTFDHIYIIDLHGNSLKKETTPDGHADQNVFDIMVGVAIIIAVKTKNTQSKKLATVHHTDFWGNRASKYQQLCEHDLKSLKKSKQFTEIKNIAPSYLFIPMDYTLGKEYKKGFQVNQLFPVNGTGVVSKRDKLAFQDTKDEMVKKIKDIYTLNTDEIKQKYHTINWDSRDGKVEYCKNNVMKFGLQDNLFVQCSYRPFDKKWTYYTGESKGFLGWPVKKIMRHMLAGDNVGLVICRTATGQKTWQEILAINSIFEFGLLATRPGNGAYLHPLYLYPPGQDSLNPQVSDHPSNRIPNLDPTIVKKISQALDIPFISDHTFPNANKKTNFSPLDILDYIYAVLYSPHYRTTYAQFLKTDFPTVPYPKDPKTFWKLVTLGGQLRHLHLLEGEDFQGIQSLITQFPVSGDNMVHTINQKSFVAYKDNGKKDNAKYGKVPLNKVPLNKVPLNKVSLGKVMINNDQYFDHVPRIAWEFFIGGYQPAQKWLKDRKNSVLSYDDILHYQYIILSLTKTYDLMQKIDKIVL